MITTTKKLRKQFLEITLSIDLKLIYPETFTKDFITTVNPIITSTVLLDKDLINQLNGFRNLPYAN